MGVILANKDNGGLGVGSLTSINIVLLFKWIWHLKTESTALWKQIITGIHY